MVLLLYIVLELMGSLVAILEKHSEDIQGDQRKISMMETKLAEIQKANCEVKKQQEKNVLLEAEKKKLVKKVDELEGQLHQHMYQAYLLNLRPPMG